MPRTGETSWTVVDGDLRPIEPAERYLAHLEAIERSPNTIRAYAHGLRLWWECLDQRQVAWDKVGAEDVSRFVAWLRAPAENVVVLDETAARRSPATVNRHLAAVFGLYDFHARSGLEVAADLVAWRGWVEGRSNRSCTTPPRAGRSPPGLSSYGLPIGYRPR